jgi:hypothetical protein
MALAKHIAGRPKVNGELVYLPGGHERGRFL